jgi:hypothetical protein
MPIDIHIDKAESLLRRTVTGSVTAEEVIAEFESTLRHPDYLLGMDSITDLRGNTHQATGEDMRRIADWLLEHCDALHGAKAAIVVSRAVSYGMMRMLQTHLDQAPVAVSLFYDLAEAEDWLRVPRTTAGDV